MTPLGVRARGSYPRFSVALRRGDDLMSADPKDVMRRFYGELLTEGKLEVLDEIVSDDYVEHQQIPGRPSGKDAARAFVTMFRAAFPDLEVDAQAMVAEGDEVWAYARMTGTHTGEFMCFSTTATTTEFYTLARHEL